jgi:hypothetical protein
VKFLWFESLIDPTARTEFDNKIVRHTKLREPWKETDQLHLPQTSGAGKSDPT